MFKTMPALFGAAAVSAAIIFTATLSTVAGAAEPAPWERQFRELPREARRLTGPLFWLHGDERETPERLAAYLEKVAQGGNGCFTAESRPHQDWLGPGWFRDLDVCLRQAKQLDLHMWIFDERWWPSQSVGGTVPPEYAAKKLVAEKLEVDGPAVLERPGYGGARYVAAVAGRLNDEAAILGETLVDLAPHVQADVLRWDVPPGRWRVIKFTHQQAPGLGQSGGKDLSVDGASRDCVDWFLQTVYQPHYERYQADFGRAIRGFFYDEPETRGDWGTELNVVLAEWGVDWKLAYVAYKDALAGDDAVAARYQYLEALAEAWGRVMYGGMEQWCRERGVASIGHFMEHGDLYVHPEFCAGDMMRLQKYSSMGGIDMVVGQLYPGQRPRDIYQTPKLGSSISHVYGKADDLAMCEIFGGYGQELTYPQMKWLTDQHQVRGINFMIPHSFNPRAPYDRDYPPYFYNDGHEPRWPLYRVYADYTNRLSLLLTGGRHVCPVAILFSGNARQIGDYETPEHLTTVLQDAQYDCDWLPWEAFEEQATLEESAVALHDERYRVLVVPPTEVISHAALAKVQAFFDQGGVVVGYGRLPTRSATVGIPSSDIVALCEALWGRNPRPRTDACRTNKAGGRTYFLERAPDIEAIRLALHQDAGVPPVVEVLAGETDGWLHVLHRVKDGRDVFLICNQDHQRGAKLFEFRVVADGFPEIWDAMRGEIAKVPHTRRGAAVEFALTLEPTESAVVVFHPSDRDLPARITEEALAAGRQFPLTRTPTPKSTPQPLEEGATRSPVEADPYVGVCELPADIDLTAVRVLLALNGVAPEEAARVTVNGRNAGGLIGRPLWLDVTAHVHHGTNEVRIEPFAPDAARLVAIARFAASCRSGLPTEPPGSR